MIGMTFDIGNTTTIETTEKRILIDITLHKTVASQLSNEKDDTSDIVDSLNCVYIFLVYKY